MGNGHDSSISDGVREWIREIQTDLKKVFESNVRIEAKLDADMEQLQDAKRAIEAHDKRIDKIEQDIAAHKGMMKTLQILGGILVGASVIGQVVIMYFQIKGGA